MVRVWLALCAMSTCACGGEERLVSAPSEPVKQAAAAAPASPVYSIPQPLPDPTVAMPEDTPRVIPDEWLTAQPQTLYIYGSDNEPSGPQVVMLTNRGGAAVTINASLSGSATLSLGAAIDGVTLAPGDTLPVVVGFAPTDHDKAGATLTVTDSNGTTIHIPVAAELLAD